MSKISKIKKLSLILILLSVMLAVAMSTVSATDTVGNTTHNRDQIQDIISGSAEGNTIILSDGNYIFNKGLIINKSVNIVGNGNVRIIAGSNVNNSANNISNYGIHIVATNVNITGVRISGFYYGISVNGTAIGGIANTKIDNSYAIENRRGINLAAVNGVLIQNTHISDNQREGINFDGTNIRIFNSELNNNKFEGVHGHASNSALINSTISNNGYGATNTSTMPGIDLHGHGVGVENFTLAGNVLQYNAGEGLALNIQKATIRNNTFSYNNGNGISIKSSNYNVTANLVDDNIIVHNGKSGIELNSAGNSQNGEYIVLANIISNNNISFNTKDGVVINKISPNRQGTEGYNGSIVENNTVSGNTISNNGGVAINNTGFGTILVDNIISNNSVVGIGDIIVNNAWAWVDIQNLISGATVNINGIDYLLSSNGTLTFVAGVYGYSAGFLVNRSINIVATGANFIGQNINQSATLANMTGGHGYLHGLHIVANNLTLTGGSFSGFYYGISVNTSNNVNIINATVNNNRRGINLAAVNGVNIDNTKISNNQREGINFDGTKIKITNSELNNNKFEGVHGHASNSALINSTISNNGYGATGASTMPGIDLHGHGAGVENFTLTGNILQYNAGEGLALNIQKATIRNNTFSYNNGNGISIKSSNYNATENLIDSNIITNNGKSGIEINSGGNNQSGEYSTSSNIISNNIIANNKNGITINRISPNRQGMEGFTGSIVENNIVSENRIFDNRENGIITTAEKTTIDKNIIFANAQVGIVNSADNNVLTNNNLFDNAEAIVDNGSNTQSENIVNGLADNTSSVNNSREGTTVTVNNIKGSYNKFVTLSAILKSGNNTLNGKLIYFYVKDILVGENRTNNQGIATFNYKITSTGTLKVNAIFHGDNQYNGSSKLNSNLVVPQMSELKIKNIATVKKRNLKVTTTIANIGYNKGKIKMSFVLNKNIVYKKPKISTGAISYNQKTRTVTWTINSLKVHKTNSAKIIWNLKASKNGKYSFTPKITKNNSIKVLSTNKLNIIAS